MKGPMKVDQPIKTNREKRFVLLDYQYESLQWQIQFLLWHGGRGSGKSKTLVIDLYNSCVRFPGGKFALTCNDYEQLRDSTHQTLVGHLMDIGCPYKYSKRDKIIYLPNSSEIHELTLNKDKTALKGPEWDGTYFDEADGKHTTEEKWDYLVDSTRGKIGDRRIRAACNPVPPGHFLGERFFNHPQPNHRGMKVSTYMNAANLPDDYIPRMEARYKPGTVEHSRWMLGDLVSLSGAVYPMFSSEQLIKYEDVPDSADLFAYGLDLGIRDPLVLLEGRMSRNGKLYITGEYYQAGLTIAEHDPRMRSLYNKGPIFADHSARDHAELRRLGWHVIPAHKERDYGINLVTTRFNQDALYICEDRCPNLVRELYNYCWKESPNLVREDTEHKHSHSPDALRYLIAGIDHQGIDL